MPKTKDPQKELSFEGLKLAYAEKTLPSESPPAEIYKYCNVYNII